MQKIITGYRRKIFAGIIIISIGIVLSNLLEGSTGSIGIVLIAVGGLFLISGLNDKKKENSKKGN